jgi:hypothetical protein
MHTSLWDSVLRQALVLAAKMALGALPALLLQASAWCCWACHQLDLLLLLLMLLLMSLSFCLLLWHLVGALESPP